MEDAENETNGKQLSTCDMGCEDNQVQSGAEPVRMSVCALLKIARPGKNSMVKEMFVVRAEEGEKPLIRVLREEHSKQREQQI